MGEIIINTTLQQRSDTAARWTEVNPVLLRGELGIEIDTGKLKVGNGETAWADLPYLSAGITKGEILDMVYPNDIVCITVTDTPPDAVLGGTWEEISAEGSEVSRQPLHFWQRRA